jgi:two-component system chemotaxis response regulator CheB
MGVSIGGMDALPLVLGLLPEDFPVPIVIVQHLHPNGNGFLVEYLNGRCALGVQQVAGGESGIAGYVYMAPPDQHLSIVNGGTLALSDGNKVNYSRPSIDVLFKSAARAYGPKLVGVLLTGASADGAGGMATIKEYGGLTVVQDPATAESPVMPQSAISACKVDFILSLEEIPKLLVRLVMG